MYQISYQKFQEGDFDLYYQLVSNNDVMDLVYNGDVFSLEKSLQRFNEILKVNAAQPMGGYFKMYYENKFIGLSKMEIDAQDADAVEIGCILKYEYQQLGFGSVITNDLIDLVKITGLSKNIVAKVNTENEITKKLMNKCGLQPYYTGLVNNTKTDYFRLKL